MFKFWEIMIFFEREFLFLKDNVQFSRDNVLRGIER